MQRTRRWSGRHSVLGITGWCVRHLSDPAVELLIHNLSTEWRGILVRQLGEEFGNFNSPSPYNLGLGSSPRVISKMLIIHPS